MKRIVTILAAFALATGTLIALTATPAFAVTTVADTPYNGSGGLWLSLSTGLGQDAAFYTHYTGEYRTALDYKYNGVTIGGQREYTISPTGDDSVCMTASTTQHGVIKSEPCQGVSQQYWLNITTGGSIYQDVSVYYLGSPPNTVNDPNHNNGATADMVTSCGGGSNGCNLLQESE